MVSDTLSQSATVVHAKVELINVQKPLLICVSYNNSGKQQCRLYVKSTQNAVGPTHLRLAASQLVCPVYVIEKVLPLPICCNDWIFHNKIIIKTRHVLKQIWFLFQFPFGFILCALFFFIRCIQCFCYKISKGKMLLFGRSVFTVWVLLVKLKPKRWHDKSLNC